MNDTTATLYCPNFTCQTPNLELQTVCRQCQTPLPKRYLWIAQRELPGYPVGSVIGDRYLVKHPRVVLDTRPGLPPVSPADIPPGVLPYLRLFPQRLHLPQVYSQFAVELKSQTAVLLLESAPLAMTTAWIQQPTLDPLLPSLEQAWPRATAWRQLNWLWQMAQLWPSLYREGVAASLLQPHLLRVEGPLLRLLELDATQAGTLDQLGQCWSEWVATTHPDLAPLLVQLSQQLQDGRLTNPETLLACLDRAILTFGQTQSCQVHLATRTDQGPSRQRNEDACYPPHGTQQHLLLHPGTSEQALTLVCDGIGGHEGGDIASNLAIQVIQRQVQTLAGSQPLPAAQVMPQLEQAVCLANDAISQRNDGEHRQERQRMGTTLVMALALAHEMYITHVGDSRVYWITRFGCHQLTVDDDLASREVRLGYSFYREALESSTSGSLVQALGMSHSASLHPTVQRLLLDEESVFLLCSDGLSDNDRVEAIWDRELLPLVQGQVDVAVVSQRLIDIANRQNGHDNATVSVIYCQARPVRSLNPEERQQLLTYSLAAEDPITTSSLSRLPTQMAVSAQPPRRRWLGLLLLGLPLLSASMALLVWWIRSSNIVAGPETPPIPASPLASPIPDRVEPVPTSPVPLPTLSVGALLRLTQPVALAAQPGNGGSRSPLPILPAGTLLQLASKQESPTQGAWLKLTICSLPTIAPTAPTAAGLKPGSTGWIQEQVFLPAALLLPAGSANCRTGTINPAATPTPP